MDTNILLENGTNELEVLEFILDGNSYGINVARLAKLPESVLDRAQVLLNSFEQKKTNKKQVQSQMLMMERIPVGLENVKKTLDMIDPNRLTPIEALQLVMDLKTEVNKKD